MKRKVLSAFQTQNVERKKKRTIFLASYTKIDNMSCYLNFVKNCH